jgi:hypothetical protein
MRNGVSLWTDKLFAETLSVRQVAAQLVLAVLDFERRPRSSPATMSVVGGRAVNICSYRVFRILTQGGHGDRTARSQKLINFRSPIDSSCNHTAYFARVDTARCLRPSRGTVNVSSRFQAPFARANGSATQAPDVFRSFMQRIIPCAISATPRLWRKRYAKL